MLHCYAMTQNNKECTRKPTHMLNGASVSEFLVCKQHMKVGVSQGFGSREILLFDVTQHDIDSGTPKSPHHCPIANAIRTKLKCNSVLAYLFGVFVYTDIEYIEYKPSHNVQEFMDSYDHSLTVFPQTLFIIKKRKGWQ